MLARPLFLVALVLTSSHGWAQTPPATQSQTPARAPAAATAPAPSLAGTWKGTTERLPLTGDFNEKVWGKNATSVRDVTLVVKPTGEATLTITRKVTDARGRTVPGSSSIEDAAIKIGDTTPGFSTRLIHDVQVLKAERRYPDNAEDRWPLERLVVGVVSFSDSRNTIEVRFEPADGQGSFADTLTRAAAPRR